MADVKIKLDHNGLKELLQSKPMLELTEKEAQAMLAGHAHHHAKSFIGFDRAKTIIYPNTNRYTE